MIVTDDVTGGKNFDSVEEYEKFVEDEIVQLQKRADQAMAEIRICMKDPCWSKNILSSPDRKPTNCEEN